MANMTFYVEVDMRFFLFGSTFYHDAISHGTVTSNTSTDWYVDEGDLGEDRFFGTGLGSPSENMPYAGTITGWDSYLSDGMGSHILGFSLTNFSLDANTFSSLLMSDGGAAILMSNNVLEAGGILDGADVITGNAETANYLLGFKGDDQIFGGALDDTLDGGAGNDQMTGGTGNDTYFVDSNSGAEMVIENADEGTDTIILKGMSSDVYVMAANVENLVNGSGTGWIVDGNQLNNVITGADGQKDELQGGDGDDTLDGGMGGNDSLNGGAGSDTYLVDDATDIVRDDPIDAGIDLIRTNVSYSLATAPGVENLIANTSSSMTLTGNGLNNVITGSGGNDTLTGEAGNDTLNGGSGTDIMVGGTGNDTFIINAAGDVVAEYAADGAIAGGTDTVKSSISYTLGANLENLTLTGSAALNGTGNGAANILTGNGAANVLNGAGGADTMKGGAGNDTYVVDNAADVVTEGSAAGTDLVQSSVTFILANNIEKLSLTGSAGINGTGNSLDNVILGNSAANILSGGAGADTMSGGDGNDIYVVENAGDKVVESSGTGGTDTVQSSVTFSLGSSVENLVLGGGNAISGSGNGLANNLVGNAVGNILDGRDGADTLDGGAGIDTIIGGYGNDILTGGSGKDKFLFDSPLSASANHDLLTDFTAVDDTIQLDQTVFAAIANLGTLSASKFFAGTAAHDADDRIIYDGATGNIYYDSDGNGAAAQVLFAHVTPGATTVTNADFVIVA